MLEHDEILLYGDVARGDEVMGLYNENFARKRAERKVMLKVIANKDIPGYMTEKSISRYVRTRQFDFDSNKEVAYFIYGDNVLIVLLESEVVAIDISSVLFASSQRELFGLLWKIARR